MSQKLVLSELIEIKHRGILPYAAYDFDIHFPFFFYYFLKQILPQNWVLPTSTCTLLHTNYDFFRQILPQVLKFSKLIGIYQRTYCYMLIKFIYNP